MKYELKDATPLVGPKPNHRSNQIFGYPGDRVILQTYFSGTKGYKIKTISKDKEGWMKVLIIDVDREELVSMGDRGMIEYDNGKWNIRNWVEIVTEKNRRK